MYRRMIWTFFREGPGLSPGKDLDLYQRMIWTLVREGPGLVSEDLDFHQGRTWTCIREGPCFCHRMIWTFVREGFGSNLYRIINIVVEIFVVLFRFLLKKIV